ncbi:MerR family transcriptional regulator [uncultured Modestobacter sp.]|uniref:MerR family transcriptional regulator n=1 Tax=uncultured Modestobacter sp. TaxID=380048 RepID=UPI00260BC06E|nr:MerR family transcriptional regulator [uncultured Modestobacter sp.]
MVTIGELARLGGVSVRMLRHYDAIGLLVPARTDGRTGRRSYDLAQLAQLNRLVALKDLGFGLSEVAELLREPVDEARVRALLHRRRAEMAQQLHDTRHRLAHVDARLRLAQGAGVSDDVRVTDVPPVELVGLERLVPADVDDLAAHVEGQFDHVGRVLDAAGRSRLAPVSRCLPLPPGSPGSPDGGLRVTTGYVVPDGLIPDGLVADGAVPGLATIGLPAARVASVVHRGPMDAVRVGVQALTGWAQRAGWSAADTAAAAQRTVFLQAGGDDRSEWVVELQLELAPDPAG